MPPAESRPDKVAAGKRLAADPDYPPKPVLRKVAATLASQWCAGCG